MTEMTPIERATYLVIDEVMRAKRKHPGDFPSHHEAYAVILEELDEYWEEVKKGGSISRSPLALEMGLIQTAAMCVRAISELCGKDV